MRLSLGKKLSITISLLIFSFSLLLSLFVISQSAKTMDEQLKERGFEIAKRISLLSGDFILHDDIWELYKIVRDTTKEEGSVENIVSYAMILDKSGNLLVHSDPLSARLGEPLELKGLDMDQIGSKDIKIEDKRDKDTIYEITSMVYSRNDKIGITRIGITKRHLEERIRMLKKRVILISAILGFFGIIAGLFISRRLTRPLYQLTRLTTTLTDADFDFNKEKKIEDIKVSFKGGKDEIGLLAESFHGMIKRLEKTINELRRSEERHRSLWEHAEDPMIRFTLDKKIIAVNKRVEDVIGYPRQQIIGSDIYSIINDNCRNIFDEIFQYTLIKGKAPTTEMEILTVDRRVLTMEVDIRPVTDNNEVIALQSHFRDISKRKEIEQELIKAARFGAMGELALTLSHEINNPLGIIMGFTQRLLDKVNAAHPFYESMRIITEEGKRCKKIMENLLTFSRPPSFEYSFVDLQGLVEDSLELLSPSLQKHEISVEKSIPDDLPELYADPSQIKQVLINIFLNAVDAMPQGGKLIISASLEDPYINIIISDSGMGIKRENLDRLFTPFFSTKEGGTGIGLLISKRIVEGHGGRIAIESELGVGATCLIWLPSKAKP